MTTDASSSEPDLDRLFADHIATLRSRSEAALAATGFDGLVLPAGRPVDVPFDDQVFPFTAAPFYRWWSPLGTPDAWICLRTGQRPVLATHRPDDFWHQSTSLPDAAWIREFDIQQLPRPLPTLPGPGSVRWAGVGDPGSLPEGVMANPPALVRWLEFDRAFKTPYEVASLRRASELAAKAHLAARAAYLAGGSEYAVHQAFCASIRQREHELPYNAIVAMGPHAATLHYQHLDRDRGCATGSMLIDAGVAAEGYASDITRTYAAAPGVLTDLIIEMDRLQQRLVAETRAGQDYVGVHLLAHRWIGDLLREAGLILIDGDDAAANGLTTVFFPHGIGHLLGLQVHDVGGRSVDRTGAIRQPPEGHRFLRLTRRLEPGFVVTVEPGIYFIDTLLARASRSALGAHIDWQRVDALRPIGGIRIEDDVLVTAEGPLNLTREAFAAQRASEGGCVSSPAAG
jgi:Xaa-Pro dipeptidase